MNKNKILALITAGVLVVAIGTALILLNLSTETVDRQDPTKIESYTLIRYEDGNNHNGTSHGKPVGTTSCYSFLSKGAKWKEIEPWVVNPSNLRGLDELFVFDNLTLDIIKWETPASKDIIGNGTSTYDIFWADTVAPDGKNEIYFDYISEPGVIAKTIIWGYFGGVPQNRELIEFDMIIDDVKYDWSSIGESGKMDFENIISHELGHAFGLGHPDDSCVEETMYRYADFGETKKRTLNTGDIKGIQELYK